MFVDLAQASMLEVMRLVGLSKPSIYRKIAAGKFPASVPLSLAVKGSMRIEIEACNAERKNTRYIERITQQATKTITAGGCLCIKVCRKDGGPDDDPI